MTGQFAWRYLSDEEWDFQLATSAFVDHLEPGDLMPHQIAAVEEFFGVDNSDLSTFDMEWFPGKPSVLV
jgi:hypothetical protein